MRDDLNCLVRSTISADIDYNLLMEQSVLLFVQIVVFDNKVDSGDSSFVLPDSSDENETGSAFLIRILMYLETPQYLRRTLCPWHNSLRFAV